MEEIEAAIVAGRYAIALTPLGSHSLPVYQYLTAPLSRPKNLPAGVYHVFLAGPSDADGTRNSEWWREGEKHDDGSVTCFAIAREMA
jgi:hypothetical protein